MRLDLRTNLHNGDVIGLMVDSLQVLRTKFNRPSTARLRRADRSTAYGKEVSSERGHEIDQYQ